MKKQLKFNLKLKKYTNLFKKVLKKYHKFLDVFCWKEADKLLEHYLYDYKIELEFGKQLLFKSIYKISLNKLKYLEKYLNKYLTKDFIKTSKLLITTFIFFAKKFEENL